MSPRVRIYSWVKRGADVTLATLGLALSLPILLVISALIKLDSPGPILFKQKRLGRFGRPFTIWKFRTMEDGAQTKGTGIFTFEGDPRITRVGKILRELSLDELPQLVNVISGSMSLVGPRPPLPDHPYVFSAYPKSALPRFEVRPGITGLAQVKGRNLLTWDQRFVLDVEYVQKLGPSLDLWILLRTVFAAADKETIVRKVGDR